MKLPKHWKKIVGFGFITGLAGFWILTIPATIDAANLPDYKPDLANGKYMFSAGGCASCHAKNGSKGKEQLKLVGGKELKTPFGSFFVPNISPDPENGIGGWSNANFVTAMVKGTSPSGQHYFPAFPFSSYQNMKITDILDLKAFLDTLPAIKSEVKDHDLPLLFSYRRGLGLWKLMFLGRGIATPYEGNDKMIKRGSYLVQGPGHCGECHTPRNPLGGLDKSRALSGAKAPEGKGFIPNITPHKTGLKSWTLQDIAYSLESGFTPEFDTFDGTMAEVQTNTAQMTPDDRLAIAAYLKYVKPIERKKKPKKKKPEKETPKKEETD